MMLQKMGEMFLMGLNGACAVAGFAFGCVAVLAVLGFIGNILCLLSGVDDNESD